MISVGIDLGTTNSVCCSIVNGKFNFVKFSGKDTLPSVLLYNDGKVQVGENARRRAVLNAEKFVKSSKTHLGDISKFWSIDDRNFSPTDVAEEVLRHIREQAEKHFKTTETISAVITVPAYFSSNQKDETRQAGVRAGFDVKRIVTEPVSAAVAYGFEDNQNGNLFIIDLGGGTFDVSILTVTDDGSDFKVIDVDGDSRLGGDDFDNVILELFLKEIRTSIGIDLSNLQTSGLSSSEYANAKQKLIDKAELLKIELSESLTAEVELPNLFAYNGQLYNFRYELSRSDFEREAHDLFQKVEDTVQRILNNNPAYASNIDKVILVGGSANLPYIQNLAERQFNKKPLSDMDLAKLVAMGAALICDNENALGNRKKIKFQDIVAKSLGIETVGNTFSKIIKRGIEYPCTISEPFTTSVNFQSSIKVNVFEGENETDVESNTFYGGFTLDNIESAPAGIPKIMVQFVYDASGILTVTATDQQTGVSHSQDIDIKMQKGVRYERPKAPTYDFVLLIDASTSMQGEKMEGAKQACALMVNNIIDISQNSIGLVLFDGSAEVLSYLSQDSQQLNNVISAVYSRGSTNMARAFQLTQEVFQNSSREKIAILFSDGAPDSRDSATREANHLKSQGVKLYTIGVGADADKCYLKKIATDESCYESVDDIHKLADIFRKIVDGLTRI